MTPEVSRSPLVGVVMGSKSDWETMRHAAEVLDRAGRTRREQGRLGAPDAASASSSMGETPKAGVWR